MIITIDRLNKKLNYLGYIFYPLINVGNNLILTILNAAKNLMSVNYPLFPYYFLYQLLNAKPIKQH